jgi:hypothetical protein
LEADGADRDGVERLGLLASALSGRALRVAPAEPGELAWTDGRTVFVDAGLGARHQLEALAVQASLLAAGSLAPEVVRRMARRPALARRYLAVEGHRALAANRHLLPPSLASLVDLDVAARADSPGGSLTAASSRQPIAEPPASFGTIRAKRLLATDERIGGASATHRDASRQRHEQVLGELGEDDGDGASDSFGSPVGGAGALGRLLQRMLGVVRELKGGGPPGADAPTHRMRAGRRGGAAASSTAMAKATEDGAAVPRGTKYPEWDVHRRRYRPDWCTVQEIEPQPADGTPPWPSGGHGLRRPLARLGMGLDRSHRQPQGDDVDIDAAVEARVEAIAGAAPDEAVYVDSLRRRRDLSVLVLLDVSGSAAEPAATGRTVHEQQRAAAAALTAALHEIGDRVALYAYRSNGRSAVQLLPVKRFDDTLDTLVMRRLHGLVPGAYSRLGAATSRRPVRRPRVRPRLRAGLRSGGRSARPGRGPAPGHGLPLSERRRRHRRRDPSARIRERRPRQAARSRAAAPRDRPAVPLGAPLRRGPAACVIDCGHPRR